MVQIKTDVNITLLVTTIGELRQILQTAILQYGDDSNTQINLHIKGNDVDISSPNAIVNHLIDSVDSVENRVHVPAT
jgi:hypothetical protein